MKLLAILLLVLISLETHAKEPQKLKVDIDFVMERDAKESWDIRSHLINKSYGEKITSKSFNGIKTQTTLINFFPTIKEGHRSMTVTLCLKDKMVRWIDLDKSPCFLYEEISFQYQTQQLIVIPSKIEHNSRYKILVTERVENRK